MKFMFPFHSVTAVMSFNERALLRPLSLKQAKKTADQHNLKTGALSFVCCLFSIIQAGKRNRKNRNL